MLTKIFADFFHRHFFSLPPVFSFFAVRRSGIRPALFTLNGNPLMFNN